jgi:hypothetical protein
LVTGWRLIWIFAPLGVIVTPAPALRFNAPVNVFSDETPAVPVPVIHWFNKQYFNVPAAESNISIESVDGVGTDLFGRSVNLKSETVAVALVGLPRKVAAGAGTSLALVTTPLAMVVAQVPPAEVTSPDRTGI